MSKDQQNIQYQFRSIEILEYSITPQPSQPDDKVIYHFEIKVEHKVNTDNMLLYVIADIVISVSEERTEVGRFKSSCIFDVNDIGSYINEASSEVNLPEEFLTILHSITLSTNRGLMFSQFRGTALHNAIMPIVNPKQFSKT